MTARIHQAADLSIRRGCGFGLIAVATTMVGLASDMALATSGAAVMLALMGAILTLKGFRAPQRGYRTTELWLLLERDHGLPEAEAQAVIGRILRARYFWHAQWAGGIAAALWMLSLTLRLR